MDNNKEELKPLEKQTNLMRTTFGEFCTAVVLYLPFAVCFSIFIKDESYYAPCSTKSSSYVWSQFASVFLIVACAFFGIGSPCFTCTTLKLRESNAPIALCFQNITAIMKFALAVVSLVNFGGLCYAYGENEKCGQLNDLILGYIIVYSVTLGIAIIAMCVACCLGCCLVGSAILTGQQNKEESISGQQELNPNTEKNEV